MLWSSGRGSLQCNASAARAKLQENPFSGHLFIFRNRRGTTLILLNFDGQGFWIARKRLSKGKFQWWPTGTGSARELEAYQAQILMAAGDPSAKAAPAWRPVRLKAS